MKKDNLSIKPYLLIGITSAIFVIIISLLSPGLVQTVDDGWLNVSYRIRGEQNIDSSIAVFYIDADDINALGGLPLKRSYYALLANALHNKGAKAIGFDIIFSESEAEYAEHDRLFASTIQHIKGVVLSGYFHTISDTEKAIEENISTRFLIPFNDNANWKYGSRFDLPYRALSDAAEGVGHSHFDNSNSIPIFVATQGMLLPSFVFELMRVWLGKHNSDVKFNQSNVLIEANENSINFPFDKNGNLNINYSGGIQSLNLISAVEFLKSYDADITGNKQDDFQYSIEGKIVLIGIIAEGRSKFIPNPFSEEFPSIGIHAMVLDNALNDNFLEYSSKTINTITIIVLGLLAGALLAIRKEIYGLLSVLGLVPLFLAISLWLFVSCNFVVPVAAPVFTIVLLFTIGMYYKHRSMKIFMRTLSDERIHFIDEIEKKQSALEKLQTELAGSSVINRTSDREDMLAQIKKYEVEINQLRTAAIDYLPDITSADANLHEREIFEGIIYANNGPMREVISFIKKIANTCSTVLILGESGTGKELVAHALHAHSDRNSKAFIPVNCGALSESLLESELFGHEKGAFTGALKERPGRFELADGGTIFLDEIGDTSESFQVKLLRVLQDGTFERVGGTSIKKVDVRIIAATNKNLKQNVIDKTFREDLYYRLNVLTIHLPPLRERQGDIPMLVKQFLFEEDENMQCSLGVMNVLRQNQWKGNIRELQSIVKRAILIAKTENRNLIQLRDLPDEIAKTSNTSLDFEEHIPILLRVKNFSRNSISETAKELGGISRGTVAEYFRGYCFKIFCESNWDIEKTVKIISESDDQKYNDKVRNKISDYFNNAIDLVDPIVGIEENIKKSKPKYKNLPQKYHTYLDRLIEAYNLKLWSKF
ncbi:MAG: sigma 54-interacting transcriptional regulator [Ignavibacteriales bacterium]|nr:sigma 54-interacting transcriptional regulator [Ignavibacteriales bacterium]